MVESLKKGITLIVDRYAYSGAAFTAAKKVSNKFATLLLLCKLSLFSFCINSIEKLLKFFRLDKYDCVCILI